MKVKVGRISLDMELQENNFEIAWSILCTIHDVFGGFEVDVCAGCISERVTQEFVHEVRVLSAMIPLSDVSCGMSMNILRCIGSPVLGVSFMESYIVTAISSGSGLMPAAPPAAHM